MIYNIPAPYPFLESVAHGLLHEYGSDPLSLSHLTVFLPTRKACFALKNAFLKASVGKPLLLPRLLPLGDLEEDDEFILNAPSDAPLPLIPTLRRQGLLAKLIYQYTTQHEGLVAPHSPASALLLAKQLTVLIDESQIEDISWEKLSTLVPDHFAQHWQMTLKFLEIVSHHWPQIIANTGCMEPQEYRKYLLKGMLDRWEKSPPTHPIIAAGSTGTRPTTAALLRAIAHLDKGTVLLPGLVEDEDPEPSTHPQNALKNFLKTMEMTPSQVSLWPCLRPLLSTSGEARLKLLTPLLKSEITLPPSDVIEEAQKDLTIHLARTPQDEALIIALALRESLETPGKTATLVCPDPDLALRVKAELERWGIVIKDSAGSPLNHSPQGLLMALILDVVLSDFGGVEVLSLLKHPLFLKATSDDVADFEIKILRQGRIQGGLDAFKDAARSHGSLSALLENLGKSLEPLTDLLPDDEPLEMRSICTRLVDVIIDLATPSFFQGDAGEMCVKFFEDLEEAASDLPPVTKADLKDLMLTLLKSYSLSSPQECHPRLSIIRPFEARLLRSDLMIVSGLNEGTWPRTLEMDPWLSRPMRTDLGLRPPEEQIGLAAHDFCQAFCGKEVILTRALRNQGTPTVPSRWLSRLEIALDLHKRNHPRSGWAQELDTPIAYRPIQRPAPCPPLSARPNRLSVTQIEMWRRDPYALYAKHILGLKPLDELEEDLSAADKGTLYHSIFEDFVKGSDHSLTRLLTIADDAFKPLEDRADVGFFWWPRFQKIARWFYETYHETAPARSVCEVSGSLTFDTSNGPFTLTAKADRVDVLADGALRLIDYKTGSPPSTQDIVQGFAPQMPLQMAILTHGTFTDITSHAVEHAEFWWLKGTGAGGEIKSIKGNLDDITSDAFLGLQHLVETFANPLQPYLAQPLASKALVYNDYAHLARIQEWQGRT